MVLSSLSTACADDVDPSQPTNTQFLKLSEGQQHWFLLGAFDSIGHAVSLQNEKQGYCIWEWYFNDLEKKKAVILKSMAKFPESSPTAVVIGHLDKACGKLPRTTGNLQ